MHFSDNRRMKYLPLFALAVMIFSCQQTTSTPGPAHVEINQQAGQFQLLVDGSPYTVKGAGLPWAKNANYAAFAEAGGNTIRTWSTGHLEQELDSAAKYGLMMAVGINLKKELHGFDYTDSAAIAEQLEQVKSIIDQYKNEPNILCWVVGNELNLLFSEDGNLKDVNPAVWDALAEMVDYIHEVDPHHPVTTTFAGINPGHIATALEHCPNLDFLGLQVYGDLIAIESLVAQAKLTLPYMVTEFGPTGHWELPTTAWGREIEEPSALKANNMMARIQRGIAKESSGLQIGHFAFLWGQKQERTPTWYGMFNSGGEATARIDELAYFWTGEYPSNRAPLTDSLLLNGQHAVSSVVLPAGEAASAEVYVRETDGDALDYQWVLLTEVGQRSQGGAHETEPTEVPIVVQAAEEGKLKFSAPTEPGEYRLFSYVYDGHGKVGNANFPFRVE